jgi:hypothetical protein
MNFGRLGTLLGGAGSVECDRVVHGADGERLNRDRTPEEWAQSKGEINE